MKRINTPIMARWQFRFGENSSWKDIGLPHDWVIEAPYNKDPGDQSQGFHTARGRGFYRKALNVAKRSDRRYFLDFDGVYENSQVFVNGKAAGRWHYGYTSFRLEVTELLTDGLNTISVIVDADTMPADRWYTGAGIYRPVSLLETAKDYVDEREIVILQDFPTPDLDLCKVTVKIPEGADFSGILYPEGCVDNAVHAEKNDGNLSFEVRNPKLWSDETPVLYTLYLCSGNPAGDEIVLRTGLRKLEFLPQKGFFVNGRETKLRGVCLHQDAGCLGQAATKDVWAERLAVLKEMGCNAIRCSHHPYASFFMDLCDSMGFYVYDEAFDKWTGGHFAPHFMTCWQADLDGLIKRDRNRPCVVVWGVGNEVENQGQPSMLKILEMLVNRVKELDATRPVSVAMNPHFKRESALDMSQVKDIQTYVDEAGDTEIWDVDEKLERIRAIAGYVDLLCCNYQDQWYEDIHRILPEKLILGTESYQYFNGAREQFKNYTLDIPSFVPERYPYVIGSMIWTGINYLGESGGYPSRGSGSGVIRSNLEKKAIYWILKSRWNAEPMVKFFAMDYTVESDRMKDMWATPPYEHHWEFPMYENGLIPYMIVSNCEETELYLDEDRIYTEAKEAFPNRLITGFVTWRAGTVTVIGKNQGKEVCRDELVTPGPAVRLAFASESMELTAQAGSCKLLQVRAFDRENHPVFRENCEVRFTINGPAKIVGVDNGNQRCLEPLDGNRVHLYKGQASVMIRMTGEKGRIRLTAMGDGLPGGETIILCM